MKITYAINGSGLGHATRSLPLIQALTDHQHNVTVYTQGLAKNFLQQQLNNIPIRELPRYARPHTNTLRGYCKSTLSSHLPFYRSQQHALTQELLKNRPDLLISDDEHTLSRIAHKHHIPHTTISFHCHGYELPSNLMATDHIQSQLLNTMMQLHLTQGQLRIHATPFPLQRQSNTLTHVPPILPKYLTQATWKPQGTHIVIYFNQALPIDYYQITQYAKQRGLHISFYGNTRHTLQSSNNQHATPHQEFIHDLLTADALICTPGSQLACEASFIGLPTALISPPRQRTQHMIARLFSQHFHNMHHMTAKAVSQKTLDQALKNTADTPTPAQLTLSGLDQTIHLIEQITNNHPESSPPLAKLSS